MARLCLFFLAALLVTQGQCESIYKKLHKYVSSKMQPMVLPQTDSSVPLWVDFQLGPFDIEDVDTQNNIVTSRFWFTYFWNSSITWKLEDYNGIQRIGFPGHTSFIPALLTLDVVEAARTSPYKVVYWFNGMTGVYMTGRWKTLCADAKDGKCTLRILSSDYPNTALTLRNKPDQLFDVSKMMADTYSKINWSNYKMLSDSYTKGVDSYEGVPGEYDYLDYTFTFKKRRSDQGPLAIFRWH